MTKMTSTKTSMTKTSVTRLTAGAALSSALLLFGGAAAANAEPGDGRVDLGVGTAGVLTGLPVETATQIAASICDSDAATISSAAAGVDASGLQQSVCTNDIGAVEFRQNTTGTATAEGAGYSEAPVTETPATETQVPAPTSERVTDAVTGDEESPTVGSHTPTTTTAVPAPSAG